MLEQYLPILLFIAIGLVFGLIPIISARILAPHRPNEAKLAEYECGFDAFLDARSQFDVRYYLVAILFIVFDLEIAFLFPWAVVAKSLGWFGFNAMMIFLGLLLVGFIYEWRRGALEWE